MAAKPGDGYIVLASGPRQYIEMAINLAASIKVMDPERPICLVHDAGADLPPGARALFDDFASLIPDPLYPNVMNKIRLFDLSPYERTMYVDADCLLVRRNVDVWWDMASTNYFSITGDKRTSGEWKGFRIEDVLRQEDAEYLIQMNAGVFYFDRSSQAQDFFQGLNEFYLRRREFLNIGLHRGVPSQTDEVYFGVYMGLCHMDSRHVQNVGDGSWMVSTWRTLHCSIDPATDRATMYKLTNNFPRRPLGPAWRRLSPTFAHFIGLKPVRLYRRLANQFRRQAGCLEQWSAP
jgi:hypothetical protein